MTFRRWKFIVPACAVMALSLLNHVRGAPENLDALEREFQRPPDDAKIMMRWWWFGPSVTESEIEREMRVMKAGGIGGFELAVVNPIAVDDPARGIRNVPYLSQDFLDDLRFTGAKARELGLRMDLTLSSGWPFGNSEVQLADAAKNLRLSLLCVPADPFGIAPVIAPVLNDGEELVGVAHGESSEPKFLISAPTRAKNAAPAFGARGYVLDHYRREAIEQHLRVVGEPLLEVLKDNPPYAIFSDSLEVARADWTPGFLAEFKRRRGYDLTPYLPALFEDIGEKTGAVRHDWGKTLTELAEDNYLKPIQAWAKQHHTRFRSQTYGTPPVTLSSNALVDLPEGELGFYWRQFSPARWASSASHLYGRPVTSTETWTWLHSPVFRATPLDLKAEADLHFLQGINQLIGHGWPYSAPTVDSPGWSFYAAGNFSEHNPWWIVMPSVSLYLQRVSYLLRQGRAANDVALYIPTADLYAGFSVSNDEGWDHVSVNRAIDRRVGSTVAAQILDAGYNFDYIDDGAIGQEGIPYPILILANVERIPLGTLNKIAAYVDRGGVVIALRRLPDLAPGLLEAETDGPKIRSLVQRIFSRPQRVEFLAQPDGLGASLQKHLMPDLSAERGIAFIHRRMDFADLYFVVNTTNAPVRSTAKFRSEFKFVTAWNPLDGKAQPAVSNPLQLELAPYESRVFILANQTNLSPTVTAVTEPSFVDLSQNWSFQLGSKPIVTLSKLSPWTDVEADRYFSGAATYRKTVTIQPEVVKDHRSLILNFGTGTPLHTRAAFGMHALLDSPVREAALVYVNDRLAGAVWCPPYEVDITQLVHAGDNEVRVVVANLAINEIAGKPLPDYQAVRDKYQSDIPKRYYGDDDLRRPLPSGLLGPIFLITR